MPLLNTQLCGTVEFGVRFEINADFHTVEVDVQKNLGVDVRFKSDYEFKNFEYLKIGTQFKSEADF